MGVMIEVSSDIFRGAFSVSGPVSDARFAIVVSSSSDARELMLHCLTRLNGCLKMRC